MWIDVNEDTLKKLKADDNYKNNFKEVDEKGYMPKSRFKEINDKLKASEEKNNTYVEQLDETKKMLEGSEEYKNKYEELNNKYDSDIQAKDKEIINTSKRFLIDQKLRDAGAKHTSLLMNQIDLEKISIENGNLLGFDSELDGLKKDYDDLFVKTNTNSNSNNSNDGVGGDDGNNNSGDVDFNNIDWEKEMADF